MIFLFSFNEAKIIKVISSIITSQSVFVDYIKSHFIDHIDMWYDGCMILSVHSRNYECCSLFVVFVEVTYGPIWPIHFCITGATISWWRHQMETLSALLILCAENSPITGEFPAQRPVTRSFDVFFDLRLNKRLNKWWFETPSWSLWRHFNGISHQRQWSKSENDVYIYHITTTQTHIMVKKTIPTKNVCIFDNIMKAVNRDFKWVISI